MKSSLFRLALLLLLPTAPMQAVEPSLAGTLLVCGMDEVFAIDHTTAEKAPLVKLWSWRAKDREDLPEPMRKAFATTDECKPIEEGTKVLITSSSGGCALVERPSGKVLWHAIVRNAHSIELLPRNRVVVASSVSTDGDRLVVFDLAKPNEPLCDFSLPSAHGVVWDEARNCLWALGFTDLRRYELQHWDTSQPSFTLRASHTLPDEDGHDLQAVPGGADLVLSTHHHVYLFNRDKPAFRLHPEIGDQSHVKCVSTDPATGRVVFIHGSDKAWWSDTLGFLKPDSKAKLGKERLYKARWLPPPAEAEAKPRTVTKITSNGHTAIVDTNDAPDLKDWGNHAGMLCVEWLPKIATLLPSVGFVSPKEVTLYFDPQMKGVAHALGNKITISAKWVRAHPEDFGMVAHELTHVVQAYPPGGPGWLVEGIADYIRIVHYEPQAPRPKIDPKKASYKDAYKTTAMFLEWMEKNHAPGLVVKLNAALREGSYAEILWQQSSGKTVDNWWALFVQTLPAN